MEQILSWLFNNLSYFIEESLSWKILGDFSLLHLIVGLGFLGLLVSFFTFGINNSNSIAYGFSRLAGGNIENNKDKHIYKEKRKGD